MPAAFSQRSAEQRADRQAKAGWSHIGADASEFDEVNGVVRRRTPIGPALPEYPPGSSAERVRITTENGEDPVELSRLTWHFDVLTWWESLRRSPQAGLMETDLDWFTARFAAGLLNDYLSSGNGILLTRAISILGKFGLTPQDRRSLRLSIDSPRERELGDVEISDSMDALDHDLAALLEGE